MTLGGFKKGDGGSPTSQQIADSQVNAMKIFWNLYDLRGSVSAITRTGEQDSLSSLTDSTWSNTPFNDGEPKDRVCYGWNSGRVQCFGRAATSIHITYLQITAGFEIFRMLKDGEFIGYGFSFLDFTGTSWHNCPFGADSYSSNNSSHVAFSSLVDGVPTDLSYFRDGFFGGGGTMTRKSEYNTAYVTINDIPFICTAISRVGGAKADERGSFTPNAGSMSAETSYNYDGIISSTSVSLSDLEFYTY